METSADSIKDLLLAKVLAMCVLGLSSFIIGISPIKLSKKINLKHANEDKNIVISLFLCFGGGVLLFTTFIHLQPEVRQSFAQLRPPIADFGVPISELVFCGGFFFVYLIEELVHVFLDRKLENQALHRTISLRKNQNPRLSVSTTKNNHPREENHNVDHLAAAAAAVHHNHNHHHHHIDENIKNSFRGLLAVLALSFHAVFEGLAVGLENSVQKVWYLFAAIATHKLVIAFCLGVELVSSKTKTLLILIYIGTFAVVTPLGIGTGIILSESGTSEIDITSVVLQGMAAGTLLYVVFFEVLARERNNSHGGIWQLLAIIAGFAIMFILQMLTGHDHGHGEEHEIPQHSHAGPELFGSPANLTDGTNLF